MAHLPTIDATGGYRTRRWDALVVGSGLASLVTAIRLGMAGHTTLVLEEEATHQGFAGLREPFFLPPVLRGNPLYEALDEIKLPLIERRRLEARPLAYQVAGPGLRIDVGERARTSEELFAWNLASADAGRSLVETLHGAAEAEARAMLADPVIRTGRLRGRGRPAAANGAGFRGLPAEIADASPDLAALLDTQVRALSNLATAPPSPEAQARLLGGVLDGGATFDDGPPWLIGLLRNRVEAVYGEFRRVPGRFDFITAAGYPGVRIENSRELLIARALVVGAPGCALEAISGPGKTPDFLRSRSESRHRVAVHLRVGRQLLPEAMCDRIILPPIRGDAPEPVVTVAVLPPSEEPGAVDLVARAIAHPEEDLDALEARIESRIRALLPFVKEEELVRIAVQRPKWDDDDWLEDPPGSASGAPTASAGWPGEVDLQVSHRPRIYHLKRAALAGLGTEGDLLLGLRAGDAIATELR